jgi:formylmethanofuran dehydrogenase subunit B
MGDARIDGKPATLQAATAEAARLLAASRFPVIAGLGTDIAGARAALALAERLGGAVDHMNSSACFNDLDVMREAGMMVTTPNEARLRADTVLLVGSGPVTAWPELPARLLAHGTAPDAGGATRRVFWICPGRAGSIVAGDAKVEIIGSDPADVPFVLASLRARIGGRPIGKTLLPLQTIDALAADLQAAHFGVAVWSAAELDTLAVEMVCGIVKDLNAKTRFTGLPLEAGDNVGGILQVCGWMTGFPMRIGFGRSRAEHDPWRFDATRLVDSGEADCALWISAYRAAAPGWSREIPTIALMRGDARMPGRPRVHIEVGRPGIDHDAVEHLAATGTLAAVAATNASEALCVARVIADIVAALPAGAGT